MTCSLSLVAETTFRRVLPLGVQQKHDQMGDPLEPGARVRSANKAEVARQVTAAVSETRIPTGCRVL